MVDDVSTAEPLAAVADQGFLAVMGKLRLSLAVAALPRVSTLIGADDGTLHVSGANLPFTLGVSTSAGCLAVSTQSEIHIFANVDRLASHHPNRRGYFDAFFFPRATYFTGNCLVHDITSTGRR